MDVELSTARRALQALRDLEWSTKRYGAQPFPAAKSLFVPCCPTCSGVKPIDYADRHFPVPAIGHREDCTLHAAITDLDAALLAQ
jgi:hypothetical protein